MNKYFHYDNFDMWDKNKWSDRSSPIAAVAHWISDNDVIHASSYKGSEDSNNSNGFFTKTKGFGFDDPVILKYWEDRGLHYKRHFIFGRWIAMVPQASLVENAEKIPMLVVVHRERKDDPYWAMKTIEHYHAYNEMAARDSMIILYVVTEDAREPVLYSDLIMETINTLAVDYKRIYFDSSAVFQMGYTLSDIPGFSFRVSKEKTTNNPDAYVEKIGSCEVPAINISHSWQNRESIAFTEVAGHRGNKHYNVDDMLHSETGRQEAEIAKLEYLYDSPDDPGFQKHWSTMGLKYTAHDYYGKRWVTLCPMGALEEPDKKLPVLVVMQEVYSYSDHLVVSALSYYHEYCKIAAQGECMLLFFAEETPKGNDLICELLRQMTELYPVDLSRVYITGHSHNGHLSLEFARTHPNVIAAVATLGNNCGLSAHTHFVLSDEQLKDLSTIDLPLINCVGCCENTYKFLVTNDGKWVPEDWQRRLKASRCPMKSVQQIGEAACSGNYVARKMGFPNDRSEVLYLNGREIYLADIQNIDGKYHLRIVASDNAPHVPTPNAQALAWSFMRRFARDSETGQIIERY